jgi:hypothetical protein
MAALEDEDLKPTMGILVEIAARRLITAMLNV